MAKFVTGGFKENPGLLKLSVSKAKTFDDCALKFRYSYIERLPRKEWEHHVFGNVLHGALEYFHQDIIEGKTDAFNVLMTGAFKKVIKEFEGRVTKEQKEEAWQILNNYLKKLAFDTNAGTNPTVISVEKDFFINIDDRVLLNGFIDRIQRDPDNVLHVSDYKTTKNKKYLKKDRFQLLTYAYVLFLEDPSLTKLRTSYILLRHDFETMVDEITRDEAMSIEKKLIEYADKIESEKLYRPSPTPLCKYCDYLDSCQDGTRFVKRLENSRDDKARKTGLVGWN